MAQSEFFLIHEADLFSFSFSRTFPAGQLDHTATLEKCGFILLRSIPKLSISSEHDYSQKKLIKLKRTFCYIKCMMAHTQRHTTDVDMAKCRREILLATFFKHQLGPSNDARNPETLISTRS